MNYEHKYDKYKNKYKNLIHINKIVNYYKTKYEFKNIKVSDLKYNNQLFEYDKNSNKLTLLDILVLTHQKCFPLNMNNNMVKNNLLLYEPDTTIYYLTDKNKLLIYGFLTKISNDYFLETVCKNFYLNYSKLCFNLIFNIITSPENINRIIKLEVDRINDPAVDCYRKLGFTGKIVNDKEIEELSSRNYLIYNYFNNSKKNIYENAILLKNVEPRIIESPYGNVEITFKKDINGNIELIYKLKK